MGKVKMTDELLRKIRELCNHPWKRNLLFQDRIKWNKLWASIDTIEDSQLAINFYLKLPDFDSTNGGYLYIYGLMQALNIQQDAISNMNNALSNIDIEFQNEYPSLYEIREHRNNSIGHPTKRGNDKSFHFISRGTIGKIKYTLASFFPKSGGVTKFEEINTLECIRVQGEILNNILQRAMEKLQSEFENHRTKFKGQRLSALIIDGFHYEFSKLYENIGKNYPLVEMDFNLIRDAYEKIKNGIIERYFSLDSSPGINSVIQTLDYLFKRLEKDLIKNKIEDEFELMTFVDALKFHFKELQEMVIEIDNEFI